MINYFAVFCLIAWVIGTSSADEKFPVKITNFQAYAIENFQSELVWKPSSQPRNLEYEFTVFFNGKTFKIPKKADYKAKSFTLRLPAYRCTPIVWKMTPIISGKRGSTVTTELIYPEQPFDIIGLEHKTDDLDNFETITWEIPKLSTKCNPKFAVQVNYHKEVIVNKPTYKVTDIIPFVYNTVRVRHFLGKGRYGTANTLTFTGKFGGDEPAPVNFTVKALTGKLQLNIVNPQHNAVKYYLVNYISGNINENITQKITTKTYDITNYRSCEESTISVRQVTKDELESPSTFLTVLTKPHIPNTPKKLKCNTKSGGIELTWEYKRVQLDWLCQHDYLIQYTDDEGVADKLTSKSNTAFVKLNKIGMRYKFKVQARAATAYVGKFSESVECAV